MIYVYGRYGRWESKVYITTPYGCKLPMAEQWVEIKPFKVMFIIDSFPGGCAPLDVQGIVSVVGQSITHCMWIWNSDDTTLYQFRFC